MAGELRRPGLDGAAARGVRPAAATQWPGSSWPAPSCALARVTATRRSASGCCARRWTAAAACGRRGTTARWLRRAGRPRAAGAARLGQVADAHGDRAPASPSSTAAGATPTAVAQELFLTPPSSSAPWRRCASGWTPSTTRRWRAPSPGLRVLRVPLTCGDAASSGPQGARQVPGARGPAEPATRWSRTDPHQEDAVTAQPRPPTDHEPARRRLVAARPLRRRGPPPRRPRLRRRPRCRGTSPSTSAPPPSPTRPTPHEVAAVVRAAAAAGLRVAPQGTGHNAGPLRRASTTSSCCARPAMRGVTIDAERRIARVEAGALWIDVVDAGGAARPRRAARLLARRRRRRLLARRRHGLVRPQLGLQTNSVTAVELVTADGDARARRRRARAASCSGRCAAAAATSASSPRSSSGSSRSTTAYAGMLVWDRDDAERVLRAWADWAADAPDAVTTVVPDPPAAAAAGDPRAAARPPARRHRRRRPATTTEAEPILGRLRALEPEIDTFARVPARVARPPAHGPRGPDARRHRRQRLLARAARRRDRRVPRRRSGPARRRRCSSPSCASSAARSAGRAEGARRAGELDGAVRPLRRSRIAATPEMAAAGAGATPTR